jgi:hypothetical protein
MMPSRDKFLEAMFEAVIPGRGNFLEAMLNNIVPRSETADDAEATGCVDPETEEVDLGAVVPLISSPRG